MSGVAYDCIADTSAVIGLIKRDPKTIVSIGNKNFAVAFITVAELLLGIQKAANQETALRRVSSLLQKCEILYASKRTPRIYAEVCHGLEQVGRRIPSNDMWIAAVAMEHGLPVAARDEHFSRVNGLQFIPC